MSTNGTSSESSPPSYFHSVDVPVSKRSSTAELPRLHLQGESIFLDGTERILYELTQAPVSGMGATLGIQQVVYKIQSSEFNPEVTSRPHLLYEAKCPNLGNFTDDGMYSIESQGGRESFSKGAALIRGKWRMFLGRLGTSWKLSFETGRKVTYFIMEIKGKEKEMVWSNESGEVVARGPLTDGSSETAHLNFTMDLDQRILHLLITAWCTIIWQSNRIRREKENQKKHKKFAPNYVKASSSHNQVRKPFGVWVSSRYL